MSGNRNWDFNVQTRALVRARVDCKRSTENADAFVNAADAVTNVLRIVIVHTLSIEASAIIADRQ
jgi:hypothetical protein